MSATIIAAVQLALLVLVAHSAWRMTRRTTITVTSEDAAYFRRGDTLGVAGKRVRITGCSGDTLIVRRLTLLEWAWLRWHP